MTAILVVSLLAVSVLLGCALASAWQRALRDPTPLPLHGMLRNQGLTVDEADHAVGIVALASAARRCAFCASGAECRRRVDAGTPPLADCPNAAMFARLTRPAA